MSTAYCNASRQDSYILYTSANCFHAGCVCMWEFGGRGLSTTPTTHTTDTNSRGVSAHAPQCGSAATLPSDPFTERKPLSLPPSLDLHQHTHTHTHTHTAHYCRLSFPTSLSSLVMKQSRSEQGTQLVAPSLSQYVSPAVFVTDRLQNFPPILRWGACAKPT